MRSQEDPSLELEWLREITPATRLAPETAIPALLEELLEVVLEVFGGDRTLGFVGDGLLAEVVEREGAGRGEPAAAGLLEDEPHQLQGDLGLALALVHNRDDRLSGKLRRALYRRGAARRCGKLESALVVWESSLVLGIPRGGKGIRGGA